MRYGFKAGRWYPEAAQRIASSEFDYAKFLGQGAILVPTPRSSPLGVGDLWPAMEICKVLIGEGLGADVEPLLTRTKALPKAHLQTTNKRPSPEEQYATMTATHQAAAAEQITIVDDFVTRGSTLIAAASRVAEANPDATVRAFALVRSISYGEVDRLQEPSEGQITYGGSGSISRHP